MPIIQSTFVFVCILKRRRRSVKILVPVIELEMAFQITVDVIVPERLQSKKTTMDLVISFHILKNKAKNN